MFSKKSLYFDDGHNKPKKYMYDYVFAEDSSQDEVYHTTTSPLIKDVLKGYSGTQPIINYYWANYKTYSLSNLSFLSHHFYFFFDINEAAVFAYGATGSGK